MSMTSLRSGRDQDIVIDEQFEFTVVSDTPEFVFLLPQSDNKPVSQYILRITKAYTRSKLGAVNILGLAAKNAIGYYKSTGTQSEIIQYLVPVFSQPVSSVIPLDYTGAERGQIYSGTDNTSFFNLGQLSGLVQFGIFKLNGVFQNENKFNQENWSLLDVDINGKLQDYDTFLLQCSVIIQYK